MTKERKAAIKQWQLLKAWIGQNPTLPIIKPIVGYGWKHNCWFCQYARNYSDTPEGIPTHQGCKRCPLNKWAVSKGVIKSCNEFGCTHKRRTLFDIVCKPTNSLADRLEACDLIIRALKGEHIWEKVE